VANCLLLYGGLDVTFIRTAKRVQDFMAIDRETAISRLKGFLTGEVTKEEIYHWALGKAMSNDFEELSRTDPLLHEALEAMMDVNHEDAQFIPSREDLEYYQRCLAGAEEFVTRRTQVQKQQNIFPKHKFLSDLDLVFRVYVLVFAVCIIIVHLIGVLLPSFLQARIPPSRLEIFSDSLPHFIYAIILLVPVRILVRDNFFFVFLFVMGFGAYYYFYISLNLIAKLSVHFLVVLVILPYGALPAALAVYLLFKERIKLNLIAEAEKADTE